ncbi:MAG: anhydro-N-acetylmuramic acid kinase [Pseudomonadota bacterium]|nr:anhydro-N-acetylmuramic acid kinase [Pseudomonadota bacterium]
MNYYIGIMSGNSLDAIDVVLVDFSEDKTKILNSYSHQIPRSIREKVISFSCDASIKELLSLDYEFASLSACAVNHLLTITKIPRSEIRAIGSHGQTLLHRPELEQPYTLQVGDPNIIATLTGLNVVADFRRKDIALGGQGAPLAPVFHKYIFRGKGLATFIVNFGGIANITCLNSKNEIELGFDSGPGNILLDLFVQNYFNCDFDDGGNIARSGVLLPSLLEKMLQDKYFLQRPPKSTGRDDFNLEWLTRFSLENFRDVDILHTLTHLTAITVVNDIKRYAEFGDIIISGGGVYNCFLCEILKTYSNNFTVVSSQEYGIEPKLVEATAFAYLAKIHIENKIVDMSKITGAVSPYKMGVFYPGLTKDLSKYNLTTPVNL